MSEGNNQVDPTRLSIEQASKLLSAAYRERIEVAKIQEDIDAGAPTNADGTINLVHYSAWQAEEMGRGD
jgi:hypothetical protein